MPRVVEAVGIEPIVFGSDFRHGEGLPEPRFQAAVEHLVDARVIVADDSADMIAQAEDRPLTV